jgi:thioredoxin-related protein
MTYPVLLNQSNLAIASSKYSVTTFPSVFIIDGKGIIRWSFSGYWPDEEPYIRQVIGEIQSGQPVNQQ